MDDYITRNEHEEFSKRMDDEDKRQNKRLEVLEENVRQIGALTTSVEKMALSVETMAKELGNQGERLGVLEGAPAKNWNTLTTVIITAIASGLITYILTQVLH